MPTRLWFQTTTRAWSRRAILEEILKLAYARVPVLIDPKIRNFPHYRPASLITPNHHEALRMTNLEEDSDDGLHQAARRDSGDDSAVMPS